MIVVRGKYEYIWFGRQKMENEWCFILYLEKSTDVNVWDKELPRLDGEMQAVVNLINKASKSWRERHEWGQGFTCNWATTTKAERSLCLGNKWGLGAYWCAEPGLEWIDDRELEELTGENNETEIFIYGSFWKSIYSCSDLVGDNSEGDIEEGNVFLRKRFQPRN